jgi:hypothetical protein
VGLPLIAVIAGSSFALIGLRRTIRAFGDLDTAVRLGWQRIVVGILLLLFALLIWPTPWSYFPVERRQGDFYVGVVQVNRITGKAVLIIVEQKAR